MKKPILILPLLFSFVFSNAQTSFTFLAGIHSASVSPNYLIYPDTVNKTVKKKIGAELGLLVNFELKGGLSIRSGLLFSSKGSNWTQFYDTTGLIERTVNQPETRKKLLYSANTILATNYIDMLLNLSYSLPVSKKVRFIIGAGPMFSFVLTCNKQFNTLSFSQSPGTEPKAHFQNEVIDLPVGKSSGSVRVFHLAYNAFAGIAFGKVSLTANYCKDINEFLEEDNRNFKHETFGVTLGFNVAATRDETNN